MCGIAGWVDYEQDLTPKTPILRAMADELSCRGPDDEGVWLSTHAAFAHRRLIVVDPEGGAQPMVIRQGSRLHVITYNGELYNTEDLRSQLSSRGHTFRGWSDTEVLLQAYSEWGPDCLKRLNGIFAFGIWDSETHSLFLARDRLGVKPLFYISRTASVIFGSELKALLRHPAVLHEVDPEGLAEIFAMGPARTPGVGIFRHVQELRPGWAMIFGPNGVRQWQYWSLQSAPHLDNVVTTVETVRSLLEDTVVRQLVADVPLCTFLSGGLDSSAVTLFAAQHRARTARAPLDTFAVNFVDQERYFHANAFQRSVDAPWARRVSDYLGTTHHEVLLDTPELVAHLGDALLARDHPGMADIDISLLLFCARVKTQATVALSGEAADEVFGGYPWCHQPDALAADTFPWARRLDDRVTILSADLIDAIRPHDYVARRYHEALEEVPRLDGETGQAQRIREILYLNLTRFLPTLLDRKDRMSMAVGLEVRVPFCDHRLVEYVWNIPWALKNLGGTPKGVLREALRGWLPDDVVDRAKTPYPTTHHPAFAESVRQEMLAVLDDTTSPLRPLLNRAKIRALIMADPRSWDLPWFGQMMGVPALFAYLLQTNQWFRHYRVSIR